MADRGFSATLGRDDLHLTEVRRPELTVQSERDIGIGKLQIYGSNAETAFAQLCGFAAPPPREQVERDGLTVAWLAPGEWLLLGPEPTVAGWIARLEATGGDQLLAVDLTHARVTFLIAGAAARPTLASHCPLDLWDKAFAVGTVARSLLGDTGMFIARLDDLPDGPQFRLVVDQTMAAYAARLLAGPSRPGANR